MPRGRGGRATSSRGHGTMGYCDTSTSEDTDIPSSVAASSSHAAMSLYDDHDEHRADRDDEEVGDDIVQEDAHPRRGRGVNRGAEIPKSPSKRPMITLIGESKRDFSSIQATRDLMPDMRRFCEGAWAEWKDVPTDTKQFMFERFSERWQWHSSDAELIRRAWDRHFNKCYKDELTKSRRRAKIKAGTEDITQTSGCGPYWIPPQHWDSLIKKWGNEDYLKRSQTAAVNRRTEHSGSMVRHTAGSIPIAQHRVNLERHLGRPPTQIELFERTHRRDKGKREFVDGKSQTVHEQYVRILDQKCRDQDGNPTQHPDFDAQAWCEATAGPRKGRLYGFGHFEHPSAILHPPNASSSQSVDQEAYQLLQSQLDEQRQQTQNLQEQFAHVLQFMASQGYQFPPQPPPSTD